MKSPSLTNTEAALPNVKPRSTSLWTSCMVSLCWELCFQMVSILLNMLIELIVVCSHHHLFIGVQSLLLISERKYEFFKNLTFIRAVSGLSVTYRM